jgi:Uma2 family endonuclease
MVANPKGPRHFYSLDEYFALEHAGDARYEYWDGDIVCMSGGSQAHGRIISNVNYRLRQKLDGGPCLAFTGDVAVKTPSLLPYRYPDATVACGELKFENFRGVDALINPVLIVEVMSPTTADHDRKEKFTAYQAISSFREYLLIAQDEPEVVHYVRQPDGRWVREDARGLDAVLRLESVSCELSSREMYEGVAFSIPD